MCVINFGAGPRSCMTTESGVRRLESQQRTSSHSVIGGAMAATSEEGEAAYRGSMGIQGCSKMPTRHRLPESRVAVSSSLTRGLVVVILGHVSPNCGVRIHIPQIVWGQVLTLNLRARLFVVGCSCLPPCHDFRGSTLITRQLKVHMGTV